MRTADITLAWVPSHGKVVAQDWTVHTGLPEHDARALNDRADSLCTELIQQEERTNNRLTDYNKNIQEAAEWSGRALRGARKVLDFYQDYVSNANAEEDEDDLPLIALADANH